MTLEGQAKLLRILEGHPFLPVGGQKEISVDVPRDRGHQSESANLRPQKRKFREDLFYRLAVFELQAPPLRERGSDMATLVDFFLDHFRRQHGRPGRAAFAGGARASCWRTNGPAMCGNCAT